LTGHLPPTLLADSRDAVGLAEASGSRRLQALTRIGLGLVAHFAGHAAEARRVLEDTLKILGGAGLAFHHEWVIQSLLGPVCLSCGDPSAAIAYARKGLEAVRGSGRPLREIDAILRWARVSITTGSDPPEAITAELERALSLVALTGAGSRAPRVLLLLGLGQLAHGNPEAAQPPLERALALFDRLGARGVTNAAHRALASARAGGSLARDMVPSAHP